MKNKSILITVIGIVFIALSKSGIFTKEVVKQSTGGFSYTTPPIENTTITIPLLIIGICLTLFGVYGIIKSNKN